MENARTVVIITGSSSGIGLATCRMLVQKGYKVYGLARNKSVDEFESYECDVTDYKRVSEIFEEIFQKEGKIDVLVNNAGIGISGAVEHISMEQNQRLFDINTMAVMNCSKLVIPYFKQNGKGKIVNTSSLAGVIPLPFQTAYSMSKSAINSFTMCLNMEVSPLNIKVCAVMPGDTSTGFTKARQKDNNSIGYGERMKKSVSKMEKDETHGDSPDKVAKVIVKQIERKNPRVIVSAGFSSKLVNVLQKILPRRLMMWVVKKMYG